MKSDFDPTDYAASIQAAIKTRWLGRSVHYYDEVTSTNDILADMALKGAPAGTMVVTDHQRLGKGRLGRRWLAPAGTSLLFSLLFRPSWPPEHASWLTMLAGVAAVEAIKSCSDLRPRLKWPNDLMLPAGGHWLKAGGMLLEGQLADGHWHASILGIGLNVNIEPGQIPTTRLPATSLLKESGRPFNRAMLLNELLMRLESGYEAADQGHSPREAWQSKLVTLGRQVTVSQVENQQALIGVAVRTDEWGRLIVLDHAGREHAVSAGDVTLSG